MDAMKRMLRLGEERKQHTRIAARTGGKITAIPLGDVLYVERWGRKSRMVTVNGDYIASQHPEELLSGLEDAVVHCHQGYWVNLARIHSLAKNEFCLDDGSRIPISRTCRSQALTRFLAYIKGESTAHP